MPSSKVPVILDTDIGDYVDDVWALAYMLQSEVLDLRFVLTANGDRERHQLRAGLAARVLCETTDPSRVTIGLGVEQWGDETPKWRHSEAVDVPECRNLHITEYGVESALNFIESESEVLILALAPVMNIAALVKTASAEQLSKCRLVLMAGSFHCGYDGSKSTEAEWNVATDRLSFLTVIEAPFKSVHIAPLNASWDFNYPSDVTEHLEDSVWGTVVQRIQNDLVKDGMDDPFALYDVVAVILAEQVLDTTSNPMLELSDPIAVEVDSGGVTTAGPPGKNAITVYATRWSSPAYKRRCLGELLRRMRRAARIKGSGSLDSLADRVARIGR